MALELIIPAYNEANRIAGTLDAYIAYFKHNTLSAKLFVVINGTTDTTEEVLENYTRLYPEYIRYEVVPERIGKGGAVVYGMSRSSADMIGFVDADNSVTPEWFDVILQPLLDDPKLGGTVASRALPKSILENRNRGRIFVSQGFNWGVNLAFNLGIKDTQCGAKLFRREVLKKALPGMVLANMAFDVDLLYNCRKAGYTIQEIPIHWIDVEGLTTKNPAKIALIMGLSTIELRLLHSPVSLLRHLFYPFWMLLLKPADRPLRFLQKEIVFPHHGA
jgi:glycosyltransferase involved in cell wall biosynthesis